MATEPFFVFLWSGRLTNILLARVSSRAGWRATPPVRRPRWRCFVGCLAPETTSVLRFGRWAWSGTSCRAGFSSGSEVVRGESAFPPPVVQGQSPPGTSPLAAACAPGEGSSGGDPCLRAAGFGRWLCRSWTWGAAKGWMDPLPWSTTWCGMPGTSCEVGRSSARACSSLTEMRFQPRCPLAKKKSSNFFTLLSFGRVFSSSYCFTAMTALILPSPSKILRKAGRRLEETVHPGKVPDAMLGLPNRTLRKSIVWFMPPSVPPCVKSRNITNRLQVWRRVSVPA